MSYCTQADLERRYTAIEIVQLADHNGDDVADVEVVAEAIADAGALIDSYLERRYRDRMPFDPVPAVLERVACVIARYNLYITSKPDEVEKPYQAAIKFLEQVGDGRVSLGAETTQPPIAGGLPQMSSDGRVFSRDNAKDFI